MKQSILCCLVIFISVVFLLPENRAKAQSSLSITNVTANNQIPKFEKLEITFQVQNSVATNTFYPFDSSPPAGLSGGTGISVNAVFTDPQGNIFTQPGFYYQEFDDQIKNGNKEWFYPKPNFSWKIRFSPNKVGTWSYYLKAQDASGSTQTQPQSFNVNSSANKGFIKVSPTDSRYFEYTDGTYFPGIGTGFDLGSIEENPVLNSVSKFQSMGQNGMQLSRFWVTQYSIYGEAYAKWYSKNKVHGTQEPRLGIVAPNNYQFNSYPNLIKPTPPIGSEYYMWLVYDNFLDNKGTPQTSDDEYPRLTACRYAFRTPVKQNTNYRVSVRYHTEGLEGPLVSGQPFGFAIKTTSEYWTTPFRCNDPDAGTLIAATYNSADHIPDPNPQNTGWSILKGTFNSGQEDFIEDLFFTLNNVADTTGDGVAGHVFIDEAWLEEANCSINCPNLFEKPKMSMYQYINQIGAYTFDKLLNLAEQNGVYLKAVMNEKNDRIFQTIDFSGQSVATPLINYFYGNKLEVTKVRWLQQAWWRYMQARWGYSTHIQSWELLNEGNAGNAEGHWDMADEFAKYMKCGVFGQAYIVDPILGRICTYKHPNSHLVSTSFSGGAYPWQFWNNGGSANTYKLYRDIDYADQHLYAHATGSEHTPGFYDSALFSKELSTLPNLFAATTKKPFIRGEVAWEFDGGTNLLEINADHGVWLHDFIWGGINSGGLVEHFFAGGHFTKQIYNLSANPPYDHRPMFKPYFDFIKDIPLNNGKYTDAVASASLTINRAWGQKDLTNNRAHLWLQNTHHIWCSIVPQDVPGCPQPKWSSLSGAEKRLSGMVTLGGFTPNLPLSAEWWTFDEFGNYLTTIQTAVSSNSSGIIILDLDTLPANVVDAGVKIGSYTALPVTYYQLLQNWFTPVFDQNTDGIVNTFDFAQLIP